MIYNQHPDDIYNNQYTLPVYIMKKKVLNIRMHMQDDTFEVYVIYNQNFYNSEAESYLKKSIRNYEMYFSSMENANLPAFAQSLLIYILFYIHIQCKLLIFFLPILAPKKIKLK